MKVKSSNISNIDYDDEAQKLTVTFKSGESYHYHDVPKKIHEALMNAESHGSYLAKNIKGVHKHSKVERNRNDDRK